jgi:spore coat protein U-like protein
MKRTVLILATFALLAMVAPAFAQTATANLAVTANVAAACSVSTTAVAFGAYNPIDPNPLLGVGSIVASCTKGTGSRIDLSSGTGSGTTTGRKMTGSLGTLNYNLYTDASRTTTWGDNIGAPGLVIPMAPDSTPRTFPVYGKVPAVQDAFAGSYADSVLVTVNF